MQLIFFLFRVTYVSPRVSVSYGIVLEQVLAESNFEQRCHRQNGVKRPDCP
jgi:hypothetical protein